MWLMLRSCREASTECHVMLRVSQSKEHVIEIDVFKKRQENLCFFLRETITKVKHVRDHVDQCSKQAKDMHCMCVV